MQWRRWGERGLKRDIDPLLGQELAPETDSGHTDSEEDSEENLPMELDPETVESLHHFTVFVLYGLYTLRFALK